MESDFRLTIELVPAPLIKKSLESILPKSIWQEVRKVVFEKYGTKCYICGALGELHCHEEWQYTLCEEFVADIYFQDLDRIIPLCQNCHAVKHIWQKTDATIEDEIRDIKWSIAVDQAKSHFMKMNNCTEQDFNRYLSEVKQEFNRLSEIKDAWNISYGQYEHYVRLMSYRKNSFNPQQLLPSYTDSLFAGQVDHIIVNGWDAPVHIANVTFSLLPTDLKSTQNTANINSQYFFWQEENSDRLGFLICQKLVHPVYGYNRECRGYIPLSENVDYVRWMSYDVDCHTGATRSGKELGIYERNCPINEVWSDYLYHIRIEDIDNICSYDLTA